MRWTLPLALVPAAYGGTAARPVAEPVVRTAALDSTTVRRLCAQPESVIAGKASCDLLDQRQPLMVFPRQAPDRPR